MFFGFMNLGVKELILVLLIVLVIFGPKKLPEIGRSFGEMLSNFRSGSKNEDNGENGENGDKAVNGAKTDENNK
ncbi:MAG: twin-arginine translocase TatA/TatE family subunit [Firmicutes bacterium HGW-Firmicutes-14]|nr:MAG: twin-arginine translocase TatA/TatE family subunit [Firmicutes bacterium HGW-Firmicutes-14]